MKNEPEKSSLFKPRYLVWLTAFFLFAVFLNIEFDLAGKSGRKLTFIISICVFILCLALVLIFVIMFRKNTKLIKYRAKVMIVIVSLLGVFIGILYPSVYNMVFYDKLEPFADKIVVLSGRVISEPAISKSGKSIGVTVLADSIVYDNDELKNVRTKVKVYFPNDTILGYGTGLKTEVNLKNPDEGGGYTGYRRYLLSDRCYFSGFAGGFESYEPHLSFVDRLCDFGIYVRNRISEYIEHVIENSDERSLMSGILIGSKSGFSDELYNDIRNSGFAHIVAVSGLHVSFLCLLLGALLRGIGKKIRVFVMIPMLILFASVASFTPSVNRAVIMMAIFLLSYILMKDPDSLTSLFIAALVLVIANPYVIFNISFIMSFVATLSLMLFAQPLCVVCYAGVQALYKRFLETKLCSKLSLVPIIRKSSYLKNIGVWISISIINLLAVPIACQIGVLPISAYLFQNITIMSVFGNLIVIPATMIVFIFGVVDFFVYLIIPALSKMISAILIEPMLSLICAVIRTFSNVGYEPPQTPGFLTIIIYYLFVIIFYYYLTLKLRKISKSVRIPVKSELFDAGKFLTFFEKGVDK